MPEENILKDTSPPPPVSKTEEHKPDHDDMFNYQCNLLDHGLLYMNFIDAIAEGDGDRIVRCWKFLLLHFYAEKKAKYAVEAQYLLLQQYCLLSPRQAYRQRWNRSTNNKGGAGNNVSLDLDLEHDNNYLKQAIKKMGPNLTEISVSRCCRILKFARGKVEGISRECDVMKRSGTHFIKSNKQDMEKLVKDLIESEALFEHLGRNYRHFVDVPKHPLHKNNLSGLCTWFNNHKKGIILGRKAR